MMDRLVVAVEWARVVPKAPSGRAWAESHLRAFSTEASTLGV
ncbi:MAG: hypothetical protein NTV86_05355 [Planctomycetota bacterium]|nr:hypothetical protein [Planctomycetota bacterium]